MATNGGSMPQHTSAYPAGNGMAPGATNNVNNGNIYHQDAMTNENQLMDAPASHPPNKLNNAHDRTGQSSGGARVKNLILALVLAIATGLAAAPVAGYKAGWAFYRRSNYLPPPQYGVPVPITLKIWVGWIKGTNSLTNLLHRARPNQVKEYTYLRDVREYGQVVGGLTIAFLLLSALVAFFYLLACLFAAMRSRKSTNAAAGRSAVPKGLSIVGLVFGILNMLWSCACYIVISIGTAIYTRRTLGATYVCWPHWCFFLAFFSGVFWLIASGLALSGRSKRRSNKAPHGTTMTHNSAYDSAPQHGKEQRTAV